MDILTKRERLAVTILNGLYSNTDISGVSMSETEAEIEVLIDLAIKAADRLLVKLDQTNESHEY